MSDANDRLTTDDLTDDQIEALINTKGFRKMLRYSRLADGISVLRDQDEIYDSLVESIRKQHSTVSSAGSIRQVLDLLVTEIEAFTEPLIDDGDQEDAENIDLDTLLTEDATDA